MFINGDWVNSFFTFDLVENNLGYFISLIGSQNIDFQFPLFHFISVFQCRVVYHIPDLFLDDCFKFMEESQVRRLECIFIHWFGIFILCAYRVLGLPRWLRELFPWKQFPIVLSSEFLRGITVRIGGFLNDFLGDFLLFLIVMENQLKVLGGGLLNSRWTFSLLLS